MGRVFAHVSTIAIVAATASFAFVATPAFAQDQTPQAEEQQGGIPEILVTTQKRAENVQDVPIAISAFTAQAFQERAVGDVANLSGITPSASPGRCSTPG